MLCSSAFSLWMLPNALILSLSLPFPTPPPPTPIPRPKPFTKPWIVFAKTEDGCVLFSLNRFRPKLKLLQSLQCFELNLPKMNSFQPRTTRKLCLQNSRSCLDLKSSPYPYFVRPNSDIKFALTLRLRASQTVSYCIYGRRFCACNERQCENPSENVNEPGATCPRRSLNLLHKLKSV